MLEPDSMDGSADVNDRGAPALLVGLGNPGPAYAQTLHNAGFLVLDRLAERLGAAPFVRDGNRVLTSARACGRDLLLMKPETFMNRSGLAVAPVLASVPEAELIVVHDDLDLPFGRLRLKQGGGAGGHRGIRSIIDVLGHGDFGRLRVGIGRPVAELDAAEYVLSVLGPELQLALNQAVDAASDALLLALEQGVAVAMNRVNRRTEPVEAEEAPADGATAG